MSGGGGRTRLRRAAGAVVVDGFFRSLARLGKLHPLANPARHDVEVRRNLAYLPGGRADHRLDVYIPRGAEGPLPVVFYVHGGGFRILSKDTHWLMGLAFARAGYLVFNVSYRLAPQHPFPQGLDDCSRALAWCVDHAPSFGGDLSRLVLAGESAGANLVSALTVMSCFRRPEPYAARVFDLGVVPRAWLPYCGILQVSDAERFGRRKPHMRRFVQDRLSEVGDAYLRGVDTAAAPLADPLVLLEGHEDPDRPLPPCFATVGTRDPLLDDTRRLTAALERRGTPCETIYYPGEVHAFHAFVWRQAARRCWRDTYRFLDTHVGE